MIFSDGDNWMTFIPRKTLIALIPVTAIWLGMAPALAQQPTPAPSACASPAPAVTASPTPAASASPAPAASPSPSVAQTPAPASPVQTADPFGEPITLEGKKVVVAKGQANWDSAFDTLIDSFKTINALLDKQGVNTGNGEAAPDSKEKDK